MFSLRANVKLPLICSGAFALNFFELDCSFESEFCPHLASEQRCQFMPCACRSNIFSLVELGDNEIDFFEQFISVGQYTSPPPHPQNILANKFAIFVINNI